MEEATRGMESDSQRQKELPGEKRCLKKRLKKGGSDIVWGNVKRGTAEREMEGADSG